MPGPEQNGTIDLLREFAARRRAEAAMEDLQEQVEAEARRRSRWIETQIWTTDYSEVAVLDVVTFRPPNPMAVSMGDIKAYRYPTEEEAPDDEGYYSEESGMITEVQRVSREAFLEVVEDEEIDPPPYLSSADVWDGDLGAGEDTKLDEEA